MYTEALSLGARPGEEVPAVKGDAGIKGPIQVRWYCMEGPFGATGASVASLHVHSCAHVAHACTAMAVHTDVSVLPAGAQPAADGAGPVQLSPARACGADAPDAGCAPAMLARVLRACRCTYARHVDACSSGGFWVVKSS